MASTRGSMQPTQAGRRGMAPTTRRPAWSGARPPPTFSPANTASHLPNGPPAPAQGSFPPLPAHANDTRSQDAQDRVLQDLAGFTGTTVNLLTKTGQCYKGIVLSTSPVGDTTGVTLKNVKEISKSGTPLKDFLFIASANIVNWQPVPADAKLPNGDTFRTDTDISKGKISRERELQAWKFIAHHNEAGDEITFGPGAANHISWDQFPASEPMFGVTTPEEQCILDEMSIFGGTADNPHVAGDIYLNINDSGVNNGDNYSVVVRGSNAYILPGARRQRHQQQHQCSAGAPAIKGPPPKTDIAKVFVNGPDGTVVAPKKVTSISAPPSLSTSSLNEPSADPLFGDFVTNERQRLTQKKQALDKKVRWTSPKLSHSSTPGHPGPVIHAHSPPDTAYNLHDIAQLNRPIPYDLVPFLAKDEEKQWQIREKATRDEFSPTFELPTARSTPRTPGVAVLPRANTGKHGTQVLEPKSFLRDAGDDHMNPTGDFAHEDTQQKDDAYDLNEIRSRFPGNLSTHITRDGESAVAAGGCADIYKGTFRVHRVEIKIAIKAIKVYSAENNQVKKTKRLRREVKVWMKLNHTNVLSLFGTTSGFGPFPAMVCPWLENGTLTSYLERCGADLEILQILTLIRGVASGLQCLHSQSIVHGDLSGSNVLIDADDRACISDFGLSTILDEIGGSTFATTSTGKPRGTLRWATPELLDLLDDEDSKTRHTRPTIQSDIYSFGGIMFQILSGKVLYHYYSRDVQVVAAIFKGATPARPDDPRVTDRRWGFIQRCWSPFRIIVQRPSSEEIVAFSIDDLVRHS